MFRVLGFKGLRVSGSKGLGKFKNFLMQPLLHESGRGQYKKGSKIVGEQP